jgi:replicative DNA helicase
MAKQTSTIKIPPQNLEAEKSVLGSLMIDKRAIDKVCDNLEPRDFYHEAHGKIYDAILDLYKNRQPIDILTVTARLREKDELKTAGGASYLAEVVNFVPTASHVGHYADIVKRKRTLRDLIDASHHISSLGYEEDKNVEQVLDEAEQKVFGIAQKSLKHDFLRIGQALESTWERIDELHKDKGKLRGVPTGFPDLDNILGGLQKSDLVVLAARPSLGKTALALDIARNVAIEEKKPVAIFSLEMSKEQLLDRILAAEAHIDSWKLRTGNLSEKGEDNDFVRIRNAMERLADAPIFIDDNAMPTLMQIRAMARRLHTEREIGLIVIDYLQLIKTNERIESRVQEVSEISRSLKALAKELNVPVLAVSQLSRAVEMRTDAIPKLADLRESGSIEQDADVVMFIYREDKAKRNSDRRGIAEIIVEKHRNGRTGKTELYFKEDEISFKSFAKNFS